MDASVKASSTASALVVAAADKAGMEGIDRTQIDAIILRESGDSSFMKQQRKRDAVVNDRIAGMKRKLSERNDAMLDHGGGSWKIGIERELEPEVERLLRSRRSMSTNVVVDMDAFYMNCELLTRPDLADVPACVGRGMILTSNYCARRYGVRSAMAGWIGDRLVEELSGGKRRLVHLPSNFDLYTQKSHEVRNVLAEYDPKMRFHSLDECYMDIAPYLSLRVGKGLKHEHVREALRKEADGGIQRGRGDSKAAYIDLLKCIPPDTLLDASAAVVEEMRKEVEKVTGGLTCSAGLASNFMLAKIASDKNKPDGQCVIGPENENILSFIRDLPVRKIPGIGRVTEKILNSFQIMTVNDLFQQRSLIKYLFKPATATFLLQRSLGWSDSLPKLDDGASIEESLTGQKGISKERTFRPGRSWSEIHLMIEDISQELSEAMKRKDLLAHTITLKVKLASFDVLSRSKSMAKGIYLQSAKDMLPIVAAMLSDLRKDHKGTFSVRLLGIRCSNLSHQNQLACRQPQIDTFLKSKEETTLSGTSNISIKGTGGAPGSVSKPIGEDKGGRVDGASSPRRKTCSNRSQNRHMSLTNGAENNMRIACPICSIPISGDNEELNQHVDACLKASSVQEVGSEESKASDIRKEKRRALASFFS